MIPIVIIFSTVTFLFLLTFLHKATGDEEYFDAGRTVPLWQLTSSFLSTNIGGGTLVALVAMAYQDSFAAVYLGLSFSLGFVLLYFISSRIRKTFDKKKMISHSEYVASEYSSHRLMTIITIYITLAYFLFFIVQLTALSLFIKEYANISYQLSVFLIGSAVVIYCTRGGLSSDIKADTIQFSLMAIILIIFLGAITFSYGQLIGIQSLSLTHAFDFKYKGALFVIIAFLAIGPSVVASMDVWQRVVAARDDRTAKRSLLLAACLIMIVFLMFTYFGSAAKILYPTIDPQSALPKLMSSMGNGFSYILLILSIISITSTADSLLIVLSATIIRSGLFEKIGLRSNLRHIRYLTASIGVVGVLFSLISLGVTTYLAAAMSSLAVLAPWLLSPLWGYRDEKFAFYTVCGSLVTLLVGTMIIPDISFIPPVLLSYSAFFVSLLNSKRNVKG